MLTAGVPRIQSLLGMHICPCGTKRNVGRAFLMPHTIMLACAGLWYENRILGRAGAGSYTVFAWDYSTLDIYMLLLGKRGLL